MASKRRNGLLKLFSLETASSQLISDGDVWSRSSDLAAKVAKAAGNGKAPVGSENHMKTGSKKNLYYNHYHDNGRKGGHSFYGSGVRGMKKLSSAKSKAVFVRTCHIL